MPALRVIGPGRAGRSLATSASRAGWRVADVLGRSDDVRAAASGVDLLVLAVPDPGVAGVAEQVAPVASTVVAHVAGALGLGVLGAHPRRASLHPLVGIPAPDTDLFGRWWAVAGDPLVRDLVADLGGRSVDVADDRRTAHHAAACIAANHLVALMGQVERVAASAGVPFEAYVDLARGALESVGERGPAAALTGPVARGDHATVARHLDAIAPDERRAYEALSDLASRLLPAAVG